MGKKKRGDGAWNWEEDAGKGLVSLSGELDFVAGPEARLKLHDFIKRTQGDVTVDLADIAYLDSTGLALFIEARRILGEQQRSIKIINPSSQVKKVFDLTQVSEMFGIEE